MRSDPHKSIRIHSATPRIFCDKSALSAAELKLLKSYAQSHALELLAVEEFRNAVFLKYGFRRLGTIVGFNLPFDLSRIAIGHGSARRDMRGGFSFDLTGNPADPRVRVKHLNSRAALITFGILGEQEDYRSWRRRGERVPAFRGHFVDLKTLASALFSRRDSLKSLAQHLKTRTQKHEAETHGRVSLKYIEYARADVQVTWECYRELKSRYAEHQLSRSPDRILSEASLGKAYLQQMGIKPLLACDPNFSRARFGEILCAYYGGRAEVRIRREISEVLCCDFKSMYPTVNALMGLWEFVIAQGMSIEDTTAETQRLLNNITLEDLQRPDSWRKLRTLAQVVPDEIALPTRAEYNEKTYTIGLNHLSASEPLWFTLSDLIAARLLTGRTPRILMALSYTPGQRQCDLKATQILGRSDFEIDPAKGDFFTRLIDLRDVAKASGDPVEKALKIIANSTSYGIFIEDNRDDAPKPEPLSVFGPNGEQVKISTRAIEHPGRYFHPLLGVLITGAARLMLAIAERVTLNLGLEWAFCDTDSLAIARPAGMSRAECQRTTKQVVDWFSPLNPYTKPGSILKIEAVNNGIDSDAIEPLYAFPISAKRYALFNIAKGGSPIIRKASAHGLGHLVDPYPESQSPTDIPPPPVSLKEIGVRRWQYDFWYKIIEAALRGHPDYVPLDWHPAFRRPAAIRYMASSPQLLNWMARWNEGKPYEQQIRPFGFLLAFIPRKGLYSEFSEDLLDEPTLGRPPKGDDYAPIAPYETDPALALGNVFDRITGGPVRPDELKTYAEVLRQYHLSPEAKFENGDFLDHGRTERRYVVATGLVWIGKEANRIGESGEPDPIQSPVQELTRKMHARL
jgi:hypothetical protein